MKNFFTLWFTGLPGSGKTTLARLVHNKLHEKKMAVEMVDSDEFVQFLEGYFDGSAHSRAMNNRCMSIVCLYLNRHHINCIAVSTAHRIENRNSNRRLIGNYIEVYCQCPLEIAEQRDTKGLYHLARQGFIAAFPGIGEPYEIPPTPEITVDTGYQTPDQCLETIMKYLFLYMETPSKKNDGI